ncbi:hypothetical protein TSTA_010650 [Talaromyces stipitatus ATCC 10500]|uniref:Zn(2)-C6 fungal-type domain-containing protein n=1 Tax=Talaromyces stipitatus (strain ATCC 10500 / CBS 375.48 / QM 6759 / NRRL 1006) TaxID=441959 RepID=B8MG82_TALSN|nr:uncharacterized protein TSTA_010650 [Talaromyces stipitatus ATCC 10500]EED15949.1 hypothetical protein TSTA_010650 [Talaromyces stipitatus ATCC 10500]
MDTGTVRREILHPIACEPCRQKKCKCDREIPVCSQCLGEPSKCNYPESGKRGLPLGYITQLEQRLAVTELALFEALATLHSLGHDETGLVKASVKSGIESRQGKQSLMEEWRKLPLRDGLTEDIETWWQAKSEKYLIQQPSAERDQPQDQLKPLSTGHSPENVTENDTITSPQASPVMEFAVSTGAAPSYPRNVHYDNDIPRQRPNFSRERVSSTDAEQHHATPEVGTGYRSIMPRETRGSEFFSSHDVQRSDAGDGNKAAILARTQSSLYF